MHGYQVGLWYSGVSNGVGGRKTRKNPAQKRVRLRNDEINGRRCKRLLRDHNAATVAVANAQLRDARDATAARAQAWQDLPDPNPNPNPDLNPNPNPNPN